MQSYSIVDLVRNIRDVTLAASKAPISLTQHRKARYVLMSKEDFEQLSARAQDPRKAYLTEDMPEESMALFLEGLQPETDHAD
jgi:PHD/YefM family antitoxin component YafN of YafNO toxin-antitoxin module